MAKRLKFFYLAEVADLDHPAYQKFISRTTSDGRVLSRRNTDEYADRWAEIRAANLAEARTKFASGEVRWNG